MQIKIEIDVKPEELRRFLGLPDVGGLQEDLIQFLRDKVGAASEGFDPATFVKDNFQLLRESSAWRKLVATARARAQDSTADAPDMATAESAGRSARRPPAADKRSPRKRSTKSRRPKAPDAD